MIQPAMVEASVPDERLHQLDNVAGALLDAYSMLAALPGHEFDDLRTSTKLALEQVARCLARELGEPPLAGPY